MKCVEKQLNLLQANHARIFQQIQELRDLEPSIASLFTIIEDVPYISVWSDSYNLYFYRIVRDIPGEISPILEELVVLGLDLSGWTSEDNPKGRSRTFSHAGWKPGLHIHLIAQVPDDGLCRVEILGYEPCEVIETVRIPGTRPITRLVCGDAG